ncbi:MAG: putative quinol monooxygenase, partial [Arachnia sp.]
PATSNALRETLAVHNVEYGKEIEMIFIVVKFKVKPEWTDLWLELTSDFTEATRAEPGNLWFDWSRSVESTDEFVLLEAFKNDAAGDHVNSDHFAKAMEDMKQALVETPQIISEQLDADGWGRMGELTIV